MILDIASEYLGSRILCELCNQWQPVSADELFNRRGVQILREVDSSIIELYNKRKLAGVYCISNPRENNKRYFTNERWPRNVSLNKLLNH